MAGNLCAQKTRQICMSDLPVDVLTQEIFSRIPVSLLLGVRPTCKRWNQLILSDPRIPEGSDLNACLLVMLTGRRTTFPFVAHNPVRDEWQLRAISWNGRPYNVGDDYGEVLFKLRDVHASAGLVLYSGYRTWDQQERVWKFQDFGDLHLVYNPVSGQRWWVPQLEMQHELRMHHNVGTDEIEPDRHYYKRGKAKLVETVDDSGRRRHKVLLVTVVVPMGENSKRGQGIIYTHVYGCGAWKRVNTTRMKCKKIWPGTRFWLIEHAFCHGRFPMFVFKADYRLLHHRKLWAFDEVEEIWKDIDLSEIAGLKSIDFVSCMQNLFAISRDEGTITFYKHTGFGSPSWDTKGCWSKQNTVSGISYQCKLHTAVNHCIYVTGDDSSQVIYNVLDGTFRSVPRHPVFEKDRSMSCLHGGSAWCFNPSPRAQFMSST